MYILFILTQKSSISLLLFAHEFIFGYCASDSY